MDIDTFKEITVKLRDGILSQEGKGDFEYEGNLYRLLSLIIRVKAGQSSEILDTVISLFLQQTEIAHKKLCLDQLVEKGTYKLFNEYDRVFTKLIYRNKQVIEQQKEIKKILRYGFILGKLLTKSRKRDKAYRILRKMKKRARSIVK